MSVHRGVPGPGGGWLGGGCLVRGVPGGDPPHTATGVGGTHPTGMHSCLSNLWWNRDMSF